MLALPPLHFYPVLTAVLFPFTFVLTYCISVALNHTEIDWPYISDTSTHPPESCIFSQLINLGALLVAIVVYIRYKQVHEFYLSHSIDRQALKLNQGALWLGWLGAFGLSLVANFQETAVFKVHFVGALLAFGIGTLYMWTQAFASHKLCSITHGVGMFRLRFILALINSIAFVVVLVTGALADKYFHGEDPCKWYPEDGGWGFHVASTVTEWILAISFDIFLFSFFWEFKQVKLDSPRICLRINRSSLVVLDNQEDSLDAALYAESILSGDDSAVA